MTETSRSRGRWYRSIRFRILSVVVALLVISSIGSTLVLRAVLFERVEDEVQESLERETDEFTLLRDGIDPEPSRSSNGSLAASRPAVQGSGSPSSGPSPRHTADRQR